MDAQYECPACGNVITIFQAEEKDYECPTKECGVGLSRLSPVILP